MAELSIEKSRVVLETKKEDNIVELRRMEYENEARNDTLQDEREAIERKYKSEDVDRARRHVLEDKVRDEQVKEVDRQYKLDLVSRVPEEIKDSLQIYASRMNVYFEDVTGDGKEVGSDIVGSRSAYRRELVDKFIEEMEKEHPLWTEDFNMDDEDIKKINRLVDAKYPLSKERKIDIPEMPSELKEFIDLFSN